jgi:hypothetical protein
MLFLLLFYLLPQCTTAQISITGQLPAGYPSEYLLYKDIGELELPRPYDTLWLEARAFRLELPADALRSVTLGLPQEYTARPVQYHIFYLRPGDQLRLDLKYASDSQQLEIKVNGPNAAGYEMLADFQRRHSTSKNYLRWFLDLPPELPNLRDTIVGKIESILQPYDSLLQTGAIDQRFHRIGSVRFRESIVQALLSDLFDKKWGKFGRGMPFAERLQLAEQLLQYSQFAKTPPFRNAVFASSRMNRLRYERLKVLELEDYADLPDTTVEDSGQTFLIPAKYASALREPNDSLREFLLARYLHFSYSSLIGPEFDRTREPVLAYFKTLYPASRHLSAILAERQKNPVRYAQLDQTPEPPPPAPHYRAWKPSIIDDAGAMTDFTFVHKGVDLNIGKYYVDIWATWCRPCLQAFAHNAPTDSLLDARGFSRLYISIDDPDRSYSQWIETIGRYHLGGRHVLAGDRLKEWLFDRFYKTAAIKLPRYLILVNGVVVHAHAAGPEDLSTLSKQLDSL